jgi:hypothetical protein
MGLGGAAGTASAVNNYSPQKGGKSGKNYDPNNVSMMSIPK